jgi:voltage-gated potassium channel
LVFLVAYSWQVLGDLQGPPGDVAGLVMTIAWAMFAVDYAGRLVLADRRWRWFGRHLLDLAVVALPILRPLRLLRLIILLGVFQRLAGRTLRGRVVVYAAGSTVGLVVLGSLAMLDAERHEPGASIVTFGDALWWAFTTITTVGYGDLTPVSVTGRCVAVVLMIGGIALLGTVTATLASWIVQRVAEEDAASRAATRRQVAELAHQIQSLEQRIIDLAATRSPYPPRSPARRARPVLRRQVKTLVSLTPGARPTPNGSPGPRPPI